jgi:hypothetical protein
MKSRLGHPSLGVVLAFAGMSTLTQPLVTIVSFVARGYMTLELAAMIGSQLALAAVQVAAGCAIAWRARWAAIAFVLYAVAALAFTIAAPFTIADDVGTLAMVAFCVELLGPVALVLVASLVPTSVTSRRADVSLVLIAFGITALIKLVLHNLDTFRVIADGRSDLDEALALALRLGLFGAIAVVELIAGIVVRGAPVARARVAIRAYVLTSVICRTVFAALSIIFVFVEDSYGFRDMRIERILMELVMLASSFVMPLLIWRYVRRELRSDHVAAERERPSVLAWSALLYATFSLARPLVLNEVLGEHVGASGVVALGILFFAHGVLLATAGSAALFRRAWAPWISIAATVIGVAVIVTMVVVMYRVERVAARFEFGPLVLIVVESAVLAWAYRKTARDRASLGAVFE